MTVHDPIRQASYLQQCLSNGKRPVGFLLGAGCPVSVRIADGAETRPLIPDSAGLTKEICASLEASPLAEHFKTLCGHFTEDGKADPSVEDMLSHLRSLRQAAGVQAVRGLITVNLDELDKAIGDAIYRIANQTLPTTDTPYHKMAVWAGAMERSYPVEFFTTNYDLLLEQALEATRVAYFDGFVGSFQPFFDPHAMEEDLLPARWARLWKIHGSISWRQDGNGVVTRALPVNDGFRRVIHPSHLKYDESRRMPYLAMMDRLRAFLRKPSAVLMICGYSFRDDHVNEVIVQGLQGTPTAAAFALLHGPMGGYQTASELARRRANLTLLARDAAIVGTRPGPWASREAPNESDAPLAVEWIVPAGQPAGSAKNAQFLLGDFAHFGTFLADLIGPDLSGDKLANAG